MLAFVPPPTTAENAVFDRPWNGIPHRNRCVRLTRSKVIVRVSDNPRNLRFMIYSSRETGTLGTSQGGVLTIEADRPFNGRICFGIAI